MEMTPTMASPSATGRWRIRWSVTTFMQWSTLSSGRTVTTFAVMMSRTGVLEARTLAFDTSDTIIVGKGQISLKNETLDLEMRPRPKDRSILALRSPLVVGGTFKDPSFRPDFKRLGLRGAVAVALGSIAPPAALLATIEVGPGEDSACGGQYAK